MKRLGVGAKLTNVDVVQVQLGQCAGPFGSLARGVEHHRGIVDGDDGRAKALNDPQRKLGPAAAKVEHA